MSTNIFQHRSYLVLMQLAPAIQAGILQRQRSALPEPVVHAGAGTPYQRLEVHYFQTFGGLNRNVQRGKGASTEKLRKLYTESVWPGLIPEPYTCKLQ